MQYLVFWLKVCVVFVVVIDRNTKKREINLNRAAINTAINTKIFTLFIRIKLDLVYTIIFNDCFTLI